MRTSTQVQLEAAEETARRIQALTTGQLAAAQRDVEAHLAQADRVLTQARAQAQQVAVLAGPARDVEPVGTSLPRRMPRRPSRDHPALPEQPHPVGPLLAASVSERPTRADWTASRGPTPCRWRCPPHIPATRSAPPLPERIRFRQRGSFETRYG